MTLRKTESDSVRITRRPPFDTSVEFCKKNNLRMKGHCLIYNSFQPKWIPEDQRELKILIEKRIAEIADRYGDIFVDMDVINEMLHIYKNAYPGFFERNLSITDDPNHEKWAFELANKYFPHTRLFWNEGGFETLANPNYSGSRSFFYMALKENIAKGAPIGGIGMQYHCYSKRDTADVKLESLCNPLRLLDALDRYGDFGLPIHISEVNVPSWSNDPYDETLQGELVKRLYRLWFSQKNVKGIVWWNLADLTAFAGENFYYISSLNQFALIDFLRPPSTSFDFHWLDRVQRTTKSRTFYMIAYKFELKRRMKNEIPEGQTACEVQSAGCNKNSVRSPKALGARTNHNIKKGLK